MNEKLNIQNLIELLAEKHGMDKADAGSFVKEFFQLIEESLENDKYVKIRGLGTFKLIDVESRESVNINTGERFEIQGHTKVSFAPEPALKDLINKPFSHFETVVLNDETVLEDTPVEDNSEEEEKEEVLVESEKSVVNTEAYLASLNSKNAMFKYGLERYNALRIMENTLNLREIKLLDNGTEYNERDTLAALEKQRLINEEFKRWIWLDEDRRWLVEEAYNNIFTGYERSLISC